MLINLGMHLPGERGWIMVDYLATNPINRTAGSGFKYVGIALLSTAVARSLEVGFEGRIRLESLPGAETFYQCLGMTKQEHYSQEGNAMYFVESQAAKQLLEEIREKRILEL